MKKCFLITLALLSMASVSFAETQVYTTISSIGNGWGEDGLYIYTPTTNNNGCTNKHIYVISSSRSDYKTISALVMLAYTQKTTIQISNNGCEGYNGKVVGVLLSN
jgi:hypothetical protein